MTTNNSSSIAMFEDCEPLVRPPTNSPHPWSEPECEFFQKWESKLWAFDHEFATRLSQVLAALDLPPQLAQSDDPFVQAQWTADNNPEAAAKAVVMLESIREFAFSVMTVLTETVQQWDSLNYTQLFKAVRFHLLSRSNYQHSLLLQLIAILTHSPNTTDAHMPAQSSKPAPPSSIDMPNLISELVQLEAIVEQNVELLPRLVAHRGFHSAVQSTHRPIENTLQAMEQAWVNGVHLCECDITLTLDGQIILSHDDTLNRLALVPESRIATALLPSLTFRQVTTSPLKSGVGSPLLIDVLESAYRIGSPAQLVIELKHSAPHVSRALAQFFATHPAYLKCVAVVMGFDRETILDFSKRLRQFLSAQQTNDEGDFVCPKTMLLTGVPGRWNCDYVVEFGIENFNAGSQDQQQTTGGSLLRDLLANDDDQNLLDGVYIEFESGMLLPDSKAQQKLRELCLVTTVGVWAATPDTSTSAKTITALGVRFVNTDFPSSFVTSRKADSY